MTTCTSNFYKKIEMQPQNLPIFATLNPWMNTKNCSLTCTHLGILGLRSNRQFDLCWCEFPFIRSFSKKSDDLCRQFLRERAVFRLLSLCFFKDIVTSTPWEIGCNSNSSRKKSVHFDLSPAQYLQLDYSRTRYSALTDRF